MNNTKSKGRINLRQIPTIYRFWGLLMIVATSACNLTGAEDCSLVTDEGIISQIDAPIDAFSEKQFVNRPNDRMRYQHRTHRGYTYLDCGKNYFVKSEITNTIVEEGIELAGDTVFYEISKATFEIVAMYIGEDRRRVPDEVFTDPDFFN